MVLRYFVRHCATLSFAFVWLLLASNAWAQKTTNHFEDLSRLLKPGDRVTVALTDGIKIKAHVVEVNAASIEITDDKSQQSRTIPSIEVDRISTRDPVTNGILTGAGIGAAAGLVGGLVINAICANETGSCPGAVIGVTLIGAAGGGAAGWGFDKAHGSSIVYERSGASRPHETATDVFGSVDYNYTSNLFVSSQKAFHPQQLSVSAGIGRHYQSGFGIEGEIQRTVQSDLTSNPCVQLSSVVVTGNCVGSAMEGVDSQLVGTGRLVYSMRSVRFQPFVSGGFSILQTVERSTYAVTVSGSPLLIQSQLRFTDYAAPVGGGFRIPLTRSIAIRPAVTYYIGAERTSVSVGVVYRHQ
ncbi:MAG TPA: hypothetical protein VFO86_07185 [Terriglobia bacterium]|nr:hypothetical protein [Terriglobia bacterium]